MTTPIRWGILATGWIANQFTEADKEIYFSAVVEVGVALLLVSTAINILARLLIWSISRGPGDVRA